MTDGKGPLNGIRVIDLGRHQAGPRCAQVLARLGAEVIKIERLGGEETRYHAPWVRKQSAYWVQYNSGKKSLSMDLRKEEGKTALRKLIQVSDVLVQNFRPGTIDEMGFGYDVLKALNPRIIMVNVSAYGQFGPYRDQIGYDPIGQTMSGIAMVTGEEGMPPIRAGRPHHRSHHRACTPPSAPWPPSSSAASPGQGQSIDVCLADSGYSLTEIPITAYHGAGTEPQRGKSDSRAQRHVPLQGRLGPDLRRRSASLASRVRAPWASPSGGTTRASPPAASAASMPTVVNEAMRELLAGMTMKDAIAHFTRHDVVAAPVNTIAQAAQDPHPWERRAMVEVPDFLAGTIAVSGDFWHFSRTPAVVGSTPKVGEHNEEVLGGLLGYSADEIARLYANDVIGNSHHYDTLSG